MESIDSIITKLEEILYESDLEPKLEYITKLFNHRERMEVFERESVMKALIRTLNDVNFKFKLLGS